MNGRGIGVTRRLALAGGCALVLAPPVYAHRSQTVLTTISWNASVSVLEVTHRLHNADAEAWLQIAGSRSSDITVIGSQAQLMIYIEEHFTLFDGAGVIALQPLGAEIEGEAILLYQERRLPAPPREIAVDNRIFRDVFEGQANLVNIKLDKKTRSLIFAGADGRKKAEGLY